MCEWALLAARLLTYVGWRTGEGVLFEVQMHDGRHEAQLDRKHGDPIAAEVQEGQLQVRDLWKGGKTNSSLGVETSSSSTAPPPPLSSNCHLIGAAVDGRRRFIIFGTSGATDSKWSAVTSVCRTRGAYARRL